MITKVVKIGNSKGIRIPTKILEKYHMLKDVEIELLDDGIGKPELLKRNLRGL